MGPLAGCRRCRLARGAGWEGAVPRRAFHACQSVCATLTCPLASPRLQVCRVYCHKVVKLSDAVQPLPKQTTEFVHGVAESFLDVGEKKAQPAPEGGKR